MALDWFKSYLTNRALLLNRNRKEHFQTPFYFLLTTCQTA